MKKNITLFTIFAFFISIITAKSHTKLDIRKVETKQQKTEKVKLSKKVETVIDAVELNTDNEPRIQNIKKTKKQKKDKQNSIENKPNLGFPEPFTNDMFPIV